MVDVEGVPSMTSPSRPAGMAILVLLAGIALGAHVLSPSSPQKEPRAGRPALELRMGLEQLRNPYWYEARGDREEARAFWDRKHWERVLKEWAGDGYNAILYWPEPWT